MTRPTSSSSCRSFVDPWPVLIEHHEGERHPSCPWARYYHVSNDFSNNCLRLHRGSRVRLTLEVISSDPNDPSGAPLFLGPSGHLDKTLSLSPSHVDMSFKYHSDANVPIIVRIPLELCQQNPWLEYIHRFTADSLTRDPDPPCTARPRPHPSLWMQSQQSATSKRRAIYVPRRSGRAKKRVEA
ncbi:hypothetical protein K474DRAFT_1713544 [Panus rudis PR-1116 ss-1]|nr:hypothetical protein K474DRAFT_1713544 [Panus rudis PR-1116 ss-1]